tara:strand:+ start:352 stop:558 length:207 start_codon:yes stop_codon:yes gene_type:complete
MVLYHSLNSDFCSVIYWEYPHNRLLGKDYYHFIFPYNKDLSPHNNLLLTNPILYGIRWVLIALQNRHF